MPPVCLQSTVMAAWRNLWVITLAGGTCTTITQLLQIQVFDRLYDRMVTGGGLTGPCIAFKPPRRRPAGDASSITSTTIIRGKTNLVIVAIYELCAPAAI